MQTKFTLRRQLLGGAAALAALRSASARPVPDSGAGAVPVPGLDADSARHRIAYQLNKAEPSYQEAIFNSISAMLQKYVDDVVIVVVVWGPGIHLLAKSPKRPVPPLFQERIRSMAQSYGIRFVACGSTMHSMGWSAADMLDFAEVADVGAAAIMELQEKGYAYLAW